jgi:putative FmdB family regulatory protein
MPIYEYCCRNCEMMFEALVRGGDTVTCPHCGGSSLDKLISAPFVSSGQTAR